MVATPRTVSLASTWQLTWNLCADLKKPLLLISLLLLFVPAIVLKVLLGFAANPAIAAIKEFTLKAGSLAGAPNYYELFGLFSTFTFTYCSGILVFLLFSSVAFFAICKIAIDFQLNRRVLPVLMSLRAGLALFFSKGLVFVVFAVLFALEQLFMSPFHVFTIFALMAPILIINEKQSVYRGIKNSLLFKYCSPQTGGPFLVAFILLAVTCMLYVGESFLGLFFQFMLYADEFVNIPSFWWLTRLPGLPFSLVYGFADCLYTAGYIFLVVFLVLFSNTLFFQVRLKISERY